LLDPYRWIKDTVRCCACGGPLQDSRHINIVCLDKLATWKYPNWGNVLVMDKYPMKRASAILCDRCVKENREAKYAIEWDNEHTYARYHKVKNLKNLPRIPDEEILRAEAELWKKRRQK